MAATAPADRLPRAAARPRPLRVAHVAPGFGIGGLERMLVDFARRCDADRFAQTFFAIGGDGPVGAELAALGRPVLALEKGEGFRPSVVLSLARELRSRGVEVVHTHNGAGLFYGAAAARMAGVRRVIHTRHGVEPISGKAALALRGAAILADRIVCVSADNHELARREGYPDRKLTTLLNGVDIDRFPCIGPSPSPKLLLVARLSAEKDVATLVRAVAVLRARGRTVGLDIVGNGPCFAELAALAQALGLDEQIRFLGEKRDTRDDLAAASVFVLPSKTEGVSLTLLEAMASGLPVVATAVGGNTEVVVDGETGILVPAGDAESLATAIERMLADPEAARRMGLNGRRRATERFDLARTIAAYEALYAG